MNRIKHLVRRGKARLRLGRMRKKGLEPGRGDPYEAAFENHEKYSEEAGKHMYEILGEVSTEKFDKEILNNRRDAIIQLMNHDNVTKKNLPEVMRGIRNSTTGKVLVIANEVERPEDLEKWMGRVSNAHGELKLIVKQIRTEKARKQHKLMSKTQKIKL